MRFSAVLCIVVFGLCYQAIDAALITEPESQAVIIGRDINLNCASDNETSYSFQWQYNALNSVPVRIVYNCQVNPEYANLYEVSRNSDGECNLRILNANVNSAGTYSCQNGFDHASAIIVMLDSNSVCSAIPASDLVAGDFIRIQCVINFNGTIAPRMLWFDNSTGFPITNATTNTFPNQVNSYIDVPVYPPTTRPYMGQTEFDPPITFVYRWILPPVNVQFPVTNILTTARVRYFQETSLVCSADGFPAPTYRWTNLETGAVFQGSTVAVTSNGISRFSCEASNTIRGSVSTLQATIAADITEGVPEYCPTTQTPEPTTTEQSTTEAPDTTTSTPPTTVTTSPEVIGECGRLLNVVPSAEATPPVNWSRLCYISRNDTTLISTPCRDLIIDLPPGFSDFNELLLRGGNFGCGLSTRDDFVQSTNACFDNYQHTSTLSACPTCQRLFLCIRLPASR